MEFRCTCEVEESENCEHCPVTLNKESVINYIKSKKETPASREIFNTDLFKRLIQNTTVRGPIDGHDELEKAIKSLRETFGSLPSSPFPLFPPSYIGGIIHTSKLTDTSNEEPEEYSDLTDYNVYYDGHKVGSVKCYEHVKGPKEHWFLDTTGDINTKMSRDCKIVEQ